MSDLSRYEATRAALDADDQEQGNKRRLLDLIMQISDSLQCKASDRDFLAEKAMMAYILRGSEKDYSTIASHAYRMADAMIAESHKRPTINQSI